MGRRLRNLTLFAAFCVGCEVFPTKPGETLAIPDPTRTGLSGANGPRGSAWIELVTQSRVTEELSVQVVFPARLGGVLDTDGAPFPAVVFLQGATISRPRYHWLASHFATRGYVVILPDNQFDLPVLDTDHAIIALRAVRNAATQPGTLHGAISPGAPAVVMGHALGGVIAAREWIAYADFAGVAMLAAFPAGSDDVTLRPGSPALLVAGASDVPTPLSQMRDAFGTFRAPRLFAQVEGLNHYAWTDSPSTDDLTTDGPRPRDPQATRRNALTILDLWLDGALRNDADARTNLMSGTFPGVMLLR